MAGLAGAVTAVRVIRGEAKFCCSSIRREKRCSMAERSGGVFVARWSTPYALQHLAIQIRRSDPGDQIPAERFRTALWLP